MKTFRAVAHHYHPRPTGASPFVVSYGYDSGMPVTEYANGIPMVTGVRYQASGAVSSYATGVNTGKNVTTTVIQDASLLARPSQIYATAQATGGRPFDTSGYTYDGGGNITFIGSDTFAYDNRSRLTSAAYSGLGNQGYQYDRYGNLLTKGGTTYSVSSSTNRLTSSSYDSRGNLTGNGGETYAYDGLDRQTTHTAAGSTWSYLYDGSNERVVKAPPAGGTWTYTLRDEGNRVATEYSGLTQSRDNVFLGNLAVVSYANSAIGGNGSVWTFYSSDHLGTPRLVTNVSGTTEESRKSWPYGEDTTAPGPFQRLRFALMERDTEASRYYDHARSHEFGLGRFLSPDKLQGDPESPRTWNRYTYALNNPLKFKDEDGESPTLVTAAAGALIGGAAGALGSVVAQVVENGGSFSDINLRDVGAAAAGGAVSGALAGATLGLSLVAEAGIGGVVAVSSVSNAFGGAVTRALDSKASTQSGNPGEIAVDLATGALGGVAGAKVGQAFSRSLPAAERQVASSLPAARQGNFGAAQSVRGHLAKIQSVKTGAEIAATVAGAKTTNVVVPIVRVQIEKKKDPEPK